MVVHIPDHHGHPVWIQESLEISVKNLNYQNWFVYAGCYLFVDIAHVETGHLSFKKSPLPAFFKKDVFFSKIYLIIGQFFTQILLKYCFRKKLRSSLLERYRFSISLRGNSVTDYDLTLVLPQAEAPFQSRIFLSGESALVWSGSRSAGGTYIN